MSRQLAGPSSLCSSEAGMQGPETETGDEPPEPRRRRGGPIPMPAEKRRSHLIAVNMTAKEWRDIQARADAAGIPARAFMRIRALGYRITPRRKTERASPGVFEAASALASLARELAEMATAATANPARQPSSQDLLQLAERAHAAGLGVFRTTPDAA